MFGAEYEETEEDVRESLAYISTELARWKKSTMIAAMYFFASCVIAFFFLGGHTLHKYWNSFGKYFPLVSIAFSFFLMHRVLMLHYAWQQRREAKRDLTDLVERRKVNDSL